MIIHLIFLPLRVILICSFPSTMRVNKSLELLLDWRKANPDAFIGDWAEARMLLLEHIKIRQEHLARRPFINDGGYIDFLLSLLEEEPEPPPKKAVINTKTAFLFAKKPQFL